MIDFDKIIDDYLLKEDKERTIGEYYCSELSNCYRQIWFKFKNPKPVDAATRRIFERGNVMHEFVRNVLARHPDTKVIQSEQSMRIPDTETGLVIAGRFDNLIEMKQGESVLVEVKSTKSLDYLTKPYPHHVMQIMPYLLIRKNMKGVILYIDNNLQIKTFEVAFDWDIFRQVILRARVIHKHLIENTIPPAECKTIEDKKWSCGYCNYAKECNLMG